MLQKCTKYLDFKGLLVLLTLCTLAQKSSTTNPELANADNCTGDFPQEPLKCVTENQQFEFYEGNLVITCNGNSSKDLILPTKINATSVLYLGIENCTLNEQEDATTTTQSQTINILKQFKNLEQFGLINNDIQTLPEQLFAYNKELNRFSLALKKPMKLPNRLLANMPQLRFVGISGELENLPADLFKNSTEVLIIGLVSKTLNAIPELIFEDQRKLMMLYLRGNNFRELPPKLLANNPDLWEFHLKNLAPIPNLPKDFFANQWALDKVSLSCGLETINEDIFQTVRRLKELTLTRNNLSTLPPHIFYNQQYLRWLNLTENGFVSLPAELLRQTKRLRTFILHESRPLSALPAEFLANLPVLQRVELRCGLTSIAADLFRNSSALEQLVLAHNKLTTLPAELLMDQPLLKILRLNENNFLYLPEHLLRHNVELQNFTLSNLIQIKALPRGFFTNTLYLLELELSCGLEILPFRDVPNLNKLRVLNLSHNNLIALPQNLPMMRQLLIFNMTHNHLKGSLDVEILNNLHLPEETTIDLSYNEIADIVLSSTELLIYRRANVDLSHNNIRRLHWLEDKHFTSLDMYTMDLADNPIDCTCQLFHFKRYIQNGCPDGNCGLALRQALNLKCQNPPNLRGRNLMEITITELPCPLNADPFIRHHSTPSFDGY